jgi:DNA repair protein RadC
VTKNKQLLFRCLESGVGGRVYINPSTTQGVVRAPQDVYKVVSPIVKGEQREVFFCLLLNTKNRVKRIHVISIGSLNASIVHPREILRPAIKYAAASIVLAHNHPTGDPAPSREDIQFTCRMGKCCELMGIELLDHVILGSRRFYSLKEHSDY